MYFVFERDGESSSFHSYLSHSLHKPYKSFPSRPGGSGNFCLTDLFRSVEMLVVVNARSRTLPPCYPTTARFAMQISVVLLLIGKGELYDRL